jgi:hypothetical protein
MKPQQTRKERGLLPRPPTRRQQLDADIVRIAATCRLDSWTSFVEAIELPMDLQLALLTSRAELVDIATPRAMNEAEVGKLYTAIKGLIQTNLALREHAAQVAQLTNRWADLFKGIATIATDVEHYANFRAVGGDLEDGEGD